MPENPNAVPHDQDDDLELADQDEEFEDDEDVDDEDEADEDEGVEEA
jgi:hypothetical protein